ncbi:MAG: D-glycero-beta-D-manno-heptose 1-phosphate adenylyltransferase [Lentimicrobiaceae bacterium]|nr:D-glycero-beta-D-manno-heptose 1-phosphate adenylyltransferase [Lentimicrobiaceae bacterium]
MKYLEKIYDKILDDKSLDKKLNLWREEGRTIVFSNGCFDILHRGHVEYLSKAADLGDILIIGLNTDDSVRRLKGPSRPVNDEKARAVVLAALEFVDAIMFFEEDTPYNLIKRVQPDVLVKGKDYKAEDIVGYDIVTAKGGKVETIELVDGFSTTKTIEKMRM